MILWNSFIISDDFSSKKLIKSYTNDIKTLTGTDKVFFSSKQNRNVAFLLFNKYGFAQTTKNLVNQKCGSVNCNSCTMKFDSNNPVILKNGFKIFPSKSSTCKSSSIIYVAICSICNDFYFGQTMTEERIRMNGHRSCFTQEKFDKSALSLHIYKDHPDRIDVGLNNYKVIIIECTNSLNLNRRESFFIWSTEADIRHLNRYKVI